MKTSSPKKAGRMYPDADEIRERVEKRMKTRAEFAIHLVIFLIFNVLAWALWMPYAYMTFPWPVIVFLLWGSGLIAHGIDARAESGGQSAAQERAVRWEMAQLYGEDWQSEANAGDYKKVRRDVEKRFKLRTDFIMHAAMFIPINLLVWIIWFATTQGQGSPWLPLVFSGLWGMGLAAHGVDTFFSAHQGSRERAIREEMEREWQQVHGEEKPKRKAKNDSRLKKAQRLQLTSDGELLDIVEDDAQESASGN